MLYQNRIKEIDVLKKEIDERRPLDKNVIQALKQYYRIGLTYTSNALEGNSLTETETKIVLQEGITIGGKLIKDHMEAIGHSNAYDLLYRLAKKPGINERDILNLHKLFYQLVDPRNAGKYRKVQVFITGTDFVPASPVQVPALVKKLAHDLPLEQKKYHPVEYAARVHLELVTIHPFVDGNGRCARLLMNLVLMQAGYVITMIPPIVRRDYIDALKFAQTTGTPEQFINFITSMVYEAHKEYSRLLTAMQK